MTEDLEALRRRMDEVTVRMLGLLKERADMSARIGAVKRERGLAVTDGDRERRLRDTVLRAAAEVGLPADTACRFLNHLLASSVRLQSGGADTHLSVFRRAREMERGGRPMIHMEVGEPDFPPPAGAGAWLREGFDAGHTRYGLPAGMERLRAALAARAAPDGALSADNVLVAPGARFAVFAAITSLLGPGDEMVVIEPAWPAYREMAMHCGAKPRIIATSMENGWEPSVSDVEDAMTPQTRMLVLCYPSNPTGAVPDKATMDGIMDAAVRRGVYVLSDETYIDYHVPGAAPASVLEYGYDRGVAARSFSKSHAMTGFRVGYAVSSPDVVSRMARVSALCLTGVAGVIQHAALRAISHDTTNNVKTVLGRLDAMAGLARDAGLEFVRPRGAMYLFARYPGAAGADIVEKCLREGLALAPGTGFGHYPEFVRLSAGTSRVEEGMHILRTVLDNNTWKR